LIDFFAFVVESQGKNYQTLFREIPYIPLGVPDMFGMFLT